MLEDEGKCCTTCGGGDAVARAKLNALIDEVLALPKYKLLFAVSSITFQQSLTLLGAYKGYLLVVAVLHALWREARDRHYFHRF